MVGSKQGTGSAFTALVAITVAVCAGLLAFGDGNPAIALAPVLGALFALAMWRLPFRVTAHAFLFLGLLFDNPNERPGRGLYKSILYYPGAVLYQPLSHSLHLPGVKLSGIEILFFLFLAVIGLRLLTADNVDGRHRLQAAAPLMRACLVSLATLFALLVYGLARGGSVQHALLQIRAMLLMPALTMMFAYAFKRRRDIPIMLGSFLLIAFVRALVCIYYYLTFVRHLPKSGGESGDGSYVTTHSDSILAAVAIVVCILSIYQQPTVRNFVVSSIVVPVVGLGIVFNNRRIAFVAVAMGCAFSYMGANAAFRRRVHQTLVVVFPLMLLYIAAGWKAQGGWAKPVQSLKSVIVQRDTSSATRDVENYNLLQTFRRNPVIGSGFGHEYVEAVKAFDISGVFEAYRYVPHNSVLWFWSVGGVIGFTLYWMFLVVGVFIAARLCRFAPSNRQAVMAMTAMSAVITYGSQCFGDMGLMSWMGCLVVSSCLGVCASLATQAGAWGTAVVPMAQASAAPAQSLPQATGAL